VLIDYFDLIDWTGRVVKAGKRGTISPRAKSILKRFSIIEDAWVDSVRQFEYRFCYAIGADKALTHYRHNLSTHWLRGQRAIQLLYRQTEAA